jgi:hypothetical protein
MGVPVVRRQRGSFADRFRKIPHADTGGFSHGSRGKSPHLEIPDDLSIPAFLRRDLPHGPEELPLAA